MNAPLTTAEAMAIAILKGDKDAARALATYILDEMFDGADQLRNSVQPIKVTEGRLRAVFYVRPELFADAEDIVNITMAYREWLRDPTKPMVFNGVERFELFELPENFHKKADG